MSPDEERSRRQYMPVRFRHGCALIDLGSCLGLSSLVKGQSLGAKSPTEPASPVSALSVYSLSFPDLISVGEGLDHVIVGAKAGAHGREWHSRQKNFGRLRSRPGC